MRFLIADDVAAGKFRGVLQVAALAGWRGTTIRVPGAAAGMASPLTRRASSAQKRGNDAAQEVSPRAPASGLPGPRAGRG